MSIRHTLKKIHKWVIKHDGIQKTRHPWIPYIGIMSVIKFSLATIMTFSYAPKTTTPWDLSDCTEIMRKTFPHHMVINKTHHDRNRLRVKYYFLKSPTCNFLLTFWSHNKWPIYLQACVFLYGWFRIKVHESENIIWWLHKYQNINKIKSCFHCETTEKNRHYITWCMNCPKPNVYRTIYANETLLGIQKISIVFIFVYPIVQGVWTNITWFLRIKSVQYVNYVFNLMLGGIPTSKWNGHKTAPCIIRQIVVCFKKQTSKLKYDSEVCTK